jgi:imidazolonepropionase-like amidohydrolase
VHLVDAGLSTHDALLAATLTAAKVCGLDQIIGSVEVGKQADLLVLDGDPLTDIAAIVDRAKIKLVMQAGQIVGA